MSDTDRIPMDDERLARWLGIAGTKDCAAILAAVTPQERDEWERFAFVEAQIILYDQGLGPLPPGVIACRGHAPRRRKRRLPPAEKEGK